MLIQTGASGSAAAAFDTTLISNSVWMDGSADGFTKPASEFDNEDGKEFTLGTWFQLTEFSVAGALFCAGTSGGYTSLRHAADNKIYFQTQVGDAILSTPNVFRDIGWYHLLLSVDTTQSTASNRVRLFINGEEVTLSGTQPAQDRVYQFNTNQIHEVGDSYENGAFEGYLAQSFMIGSKSIQRDFAITDFLDSQTFGSNGSQFIPKAHSEIKTIVDTGSSNSFLLQYENSSALGTDSSTNTNTFTATDMGSTNQSRNTPSLVYPRVNVARPAISGKSFSEGALKVSSISGFGNGNVLTTFPLSTGGYWYWEIIDAAASANQTYGIAKEDAGANSSGLGGDTKAWGFYNNQYRHNGNIGAVPDSPTNTGTRYMFAVDVDAGKFFMGNDGTWWKPVGGSTAGDPAAGTNPAFTDADIAEGDTFPAMDLWSSDSATFVFDEDDFAHTIPTGFLALKSSNLTAPTHQGCDQFSAVTYTGNGSTRSITTDIAPALVWIKNRSQADEHKLVDIVRGVQKELSSDDASTSEQTDSNGVTAFSSSSFSLGSGANGYNDNTENFLAWCWAAGTAFSNDASATGIGSLDSSGRVNACDSLSIISYTGNNTDNASFKHGLSAAPELVIHRERDNANGWLVGATLVGYDQMLRLDTADAKLADSDTWSDVAPNSSIITLGAGNGTNRAGAMICYAFRSVPGVCKVTTYVGGGSSNPYVSLGFKPRWILIKSVTTARDWVIFDSARDTSNVSDTRLDASKTGAEFAAALDLDILADGFCLKSSDIDGNASGVTYLVLSMADYAGGGTLPPIYGR